MNILKEFFDYSEGIASVSLKIFKPPFFSRAEQLVASQGLVTPNKTNSEVREGLLGVCAFNFELILQISPILMFLYLVETFLFTKGIECYLASLHFQKVANINWKKLTNFPHMKDAWVFPSISRSTGKCSKTNPMGRTWETGKNK